MDQVFAGRVRRVERIHGPYYANVVYHRSDLRQQFAHLSSALPMFLEFKRRWHQAAGLTLGAEIRDRIRSLPRVFGDRWLWIEHVDLRRPSGEKQEYDVLSLGGIPRADVMTQCCGARLFLP